MIFQSPRRIFLGTDSACPLTCFFTTDSYRFLELLHPLFYGLNSLALRKGYSSKPSIPKK
jgi:hypothetical protein